MDEETRLTNARTARLAVADYLQAFKWDSFLTVTFRVPRHDHIYTLRKVDDFLGRSCGVGRDFLATEPFRTGPELHVHGLVWYSENLYHSQREHEAAWSKLFRYFGRTEISAVRGPGAVSAYCAKYVTKGDNEYWFGGGHWAWKEGVLTDVVQ